jgi:putative protein-disulfide isomerase
MVPVVLYCYDAYCSWCYGFSPVVKRIAEEHAHQFSFEVLSGGMIITDTPRHIDVTAGYLQQTYKTVEELTGITFGADYLWHINNPDRSDWFPSSEKPAIAMCIFKEYFPDNQVAFAADLQYALQYEGRDLCDDEAYRHLLDKYQLPEAAFYTKLKDGGYKEKAYYEFALVKQLQVTGFPTVLLQVSESKFYLLAKGYTDYDIFKQRLEQVSRELESR